MSCLLPDPLKPPPGLQSCERSSLFHHSFVFEGREVRVYTVLFLQVFFFFKNHFLYTCFEFSSFPGLCLSPLGSAQSLQGPGRG